MYRINRQFEIQTAHVLSRHQGPCRYPHGHTYRVEVTLAAEQLDENDMVCDFQVLKALAQQALQRFDHAMILNSADQATCRSQADNPRLVVLQGTEPTSEVLAREIFQIIQTALGRGEAETERGDRYKINPLLKLEKVRVWESSVAWAEYQV